MSKWFKIRDSSEGDYWDGFIVVRNFETGKEYHLCVIKEDDKKETKTSWYWRSGILWNSENFSTKEDAIKWLESITGGWEDRIADHKEEKSIEPIVEEKPQETIKEEAIKWLESIIGSWKDRLDNLYRKNRKILFIVVLFIIGSLILNYYTNEVSMKAYGSLGDKKLYMKYLESDYPSILDSIKKTNIIGTELKETYPIKERDHMMACTTREQIKMDDMYQFLFSPCERANPNFWKGGYSHIFYNEIWSFNTPYGRINTYWKDGKFKLEIGYYNDGNINYVRDRITFQRFYIPIAIEQLKLDEPL